MWHKSLWWRNGSPIRRFASGVFTCIFVLCVWRVSYKHSWEAAGEAWMSPLAVLWRKEKRKKKKTLATSQDASGWPGCASCSPTVFEPDSCKSRHCYSPGTYCLVDFQTQTALSHVCTTLSSIHLSIPQVFILCITSCFHTESKHPCSIPSLCTQCECALFSLARWISSRDHLIREGLLGKDKKGPQVENLTLMRISFYSKYANDID